jgi:hypothetical protein
MFPASKLPQCEKKVMQISGTEKNGASFNGS